MRKLLTVIVYTLVILLIGRNIPSLPRFQLFYSPKQTASDLKTQTQKIITGKKGNYGIYFADFNNGTSFGINEHQTMTAASVNKVAIVATLYHLAAEKKINLDEQITLTKIDIQDYGTGSLRYQKPGGTYSLQTLARLCLKESDNTAAHILNNRLGVGTIQNYIDSLGLTQTDMDNNKTSAYDQYLLFKDLYDNKITNKSYTQEILGFMTDTDIEDRLPLLLPKSAIVYHKTGDAVGNLHDVGIIEYNHHLFFLGILTSDIGTGETDTKETIAKIAKNVTDYYDNHQ